jgi:hypothetical protein
MCETGVHHAVAVCAIGTLGERRGFRTAGSELKTRSGQWRPKSLEPGAASPPTRATYLHESGDRSRGAGFRGAFCATRAPLRRTLNGEAR